MGFASAKIAVLGLGLVVLSTTQTPLPTPPSPDALQAGSVAAVTAKELVGAYYFGDGLGVNCSLELLTGGRFKFRWTGCLGEYDSNEGNWTVQGDLVLLHPERENQHEGFEGVNIRFTPVIWNHHLFLVDEYEAPGFMAALKSGDVYGLDKMHGQDFIKRNEKFEPVVFDRANTLPKRFEFFFKNGSVQAHVVAINDDGTVTLDRGSADGLRPGLMLCPDEWYTADLEVIRVEQHRATARPGYFFNGTRLVQIDDLYSTGGRFSRPRGTGWERLPAPPKPPPSK